MLKWDSKDFVFKWNDKYLPASLMEIRVLRSLISAKGETVSRARLLSAANIGTKYRPKLRTMDVHINRVRGKTCRSLIHSDHSKGYFIDMKMVDNG